MAAKARVHIHNRQASRIWHALPQRDFIIRSNVTTPCPISNQAYLPRELDTNGPPVWANADTVNALEHESARISPWWYEVYGLVLPVSVKQPYKPFAPEGSIDIAAVSQGRNYFHSHHRFCPSLLSATIHCSLSSEGFNLHARVTSYKQSCQQHLLQHQP